jgi:hypothetical protein
MGFETALVFLATLLVAVSIHVCNDLQLLFLLAIANGKLLLVQFGE